MSGPIQDRARALHPAEHRSLPSGPSRSARRAGAAAAARPIPSAAETAGG